MNLDDWAEMYVTEERRQRFRDVIAERLDCLTLVFEHVGDPGNISACIRVADSFGIGTVLNYADGRYRSNPQISMHTDLWVDVLNLQSFDDTVDHVRQQGYALVGSVVPGNGGTPIDEFELPERAALVIGCERNGISSEMRAACDHLVTIPTWGFADSLNLATATAIMVRHFRQGYHQLAGPHLHLPEPEQERLYRFWLERDVRAKLRKRGIPADF